MNERGEKQWGNGRVRGSDEATMKHETDTILKSHGLYMHEQITEIGRAHV